MCVIKPVTTVGKRNSVLLGSSGRQDGTHLSKFPLLRAQEAGLFVCQFTSVIMECCWWGGGEKGGINSLAFLAHSWCRPGWCPEPEKTCRQNSQVRTFESQQPRNADSPVWSPRGKGREPETHPFSHPSNPAQGFLPAILPQSPNNLKRTLGVDFPSLHCPSGHDHLLHQGGYYVGQTSHSSQLSATHQNKIQNAQTNPRGLGPGMFSPHRSHWCFQQCHLLSSFLPSPHS